MDISIIIPCFNLEKCLERCLRSILWQDYDKKNYEIIIVFDSCTDRSKEVAQNCLRGSGILPLPFYNVAPTHGNKYYLPETKAWVAAANQKVGTKVLLSDGNHGIIEAVRDIHYDTPQTTYNFKEWSV